VTLCRILCAGIGLLLFALSTARAQELPLWEVGIGAGVLHLPYYRGVDQTRVYGIPFPYLIYRGKYLRVDESGAHGRLFQSDAVKLELSLAGGVPVTGDGNSPRQGMPDLDPTVELGPSMEIRLWQNHDHRRKLWLNLPLRSAISVSLQKIAQQGWTFTPYVEYTVESPHPGDWKLGLAWGPLYADSAYHDYFYAVEPGYATLTRPAYSSPGGYSGNRVTLSLQRNIGDLWIGAFARYDDLSHAAFLDSPLVNTHHYLATGLAFTWIFSKSSTMVSVARE
jgi:outer membrane scaffolding protein for murein synthesis (MipA/OmpV family)